jgi:hypothetical protein
MSIAEWNHEKGLYQLERFSSIGKATYDQQGDDLQARGLYLTTPQNRPSLG